MRCQELNDRLLLLAYDDLDAQERARCEEHLAGCPACRAELATLRETQRLLNLAPQRQTQIDLAAVCLRVAARERRNRVAWRWGLGAAGVAASVAAVMCFSLCDVAIEPGRVVVAWQQPVPDGSAIEPGRNGRGAADTQFAAREPAAEHDSDDALPGSSTGVARPVDFQTTLLDWQGAALATNAFRSRRGLPGASWEAMRYAQPTFDAASSPAQSTTYGELRRALFQSHDESTTPRVPPGA